jgi:mannose-6-phosphate isomerase-like protein (cupin superfamily)
MSRGSTLNIESTFLRLRSDASVEALPVDDTFWRRLVNGGLGTFRNEFLVSFYECDSDWTTWEKHPNGDEVGVLLSGAVTLVFEGENGHEETELNEAGAFVIIPKGTWHTAKVHTLSRMLFITAGEGTENRETMVKQA